MSEVTDPKKPTGRKRSAEEQLVQVRRELRETQLELAATKDLLATVNQRLIEVLESTSWKVTTPLRTIGDFLQGLRGHRPPETTNALRDVDEPPGEVRRLYPEFDSRLDRSTRTRIKQHIAENPGLRDQLVSVVLPTHDRAHVLPLAIESVLAQTHTRWELLVIDDGSTDDTGAVVAAYADDRIRYVPIEKSGVGPARNRGLDLVTGEWIAFLDSDNTWDPEFLELMVGGLSSLGATVGYSAIAVRENGNVTGYRGDDFDFDECLEANYVDLNSLVLHRSLIEAGHRFDPSIRRTGDWDFLLSIATDFEPSYIPFVGVNYRHDDVPERITTLEPWLFRKVVQERHRRRRNQGADRPAPFEEVLRSVSLNIVIRTAAHYHERFNWGDHYFAMGLAQAFERMGHDATVLYLDDEPNPFHDVQIVLRGLAFYPPFPGAVNVLWSISHPDETEFAEYLDYDIAAVASQQYAWFLTEATQKPVHAVYQATDRARFYPRDDTIPGEHLLFVGNSREVFRPSIQYALEEGRELVVYGSGWDGIVPPEMVKGSFISGQEVGDQYAAAGAVLNDHWDSMRDFGYVSNRIYDVVASGGVPVTDTFPELEREFGDLVETFSGPDDFGRAADAAIARRREVDLEHALKVLNHHTFDERAGQILDLVYRFMGAPGDAEAEEDGAIQVALAVPYRDRPVWPDDVFTRVVCPLTSDLPEGRVRVRPLRPEDRPDKPADALVLHASALADPVWMTHVESHRAAGRPVLVDAAGPIDDPTGLDWVDAFWVPESSYAPDAARAVVVPDTLDPRLWRTYRRPATRQAGPVRMLIDLLTLGPDVLDVVRPAMERLWEEHEGTFTVLAVGRGHSDDTPEWLLNFPVPPEFRSPAQVARWMRDTGRTCDVALLVDTGQPARSLDLAWMQYLAVGTRVLVASDRGVTHPLHGDRRRDDEWPDTLAGYLHDPDALASAVEEARAEGETLWARRSCRELGSMLVRQVLDRP